MKFKFLMAWVVPMLVMVGYTVLEYPCNSDMRGWWPMALGFYAILSVVYAGLFVWLDKYLNFSPKVTGLLHFGVFVLLVVWLLYDVEFCNPLIIN